MLLRLFTPKPPRPGELVTVNMHIPVNHVFGPRYLQCQGVVIRHDSQGKNWTAIAVKTLRMQFCDRPQELLSRAVSEGE
jgi:hypothetical protein